MCTFITPIKGQHTYVLGIDFGHGETSADICNIQWDDPFNNLGRPESIEILHNLKAIKSALLVERYTNDHGAQTCQYFIGDEAISRYSSKHKKVSAGESEPLFKAYFKKKPSLMSNDEKTIMATFMREVYRHIRQRCSQLTDDNHIVYIACPSNPDEWSESELNSYCEIALQAGLPIGKINNQSIGIIRESRAAFLKARFDPNSKSSIKEGILLIDFGSSTVDLTYYSSLYTDKPIDGGGNCGASNFEKIIKDDLVRRIPIVAQSVNQSDYCENAILLAIREAKEKYYRYSEEDLEISLSLTKVSAGLVLGSIEEYYSLNQIEDLLKDYKSSIKDCFNSFKKEIQGYPIKLIFMTGGASRMGFIQEIARDVFHYQNNIYIENDPSLTISNGIALAARADLRAYELERQLLSLSALTKDISDNVLEDTSNKVAQNAIDKIEYIYKGFAESSYNKSISVIENELKNSVKNIPCSNYLNETFSECVRKEVNSLIIKDLNDIVGNYFPDETIPQIKPNTLFSIKTTGNISIEKLISDSVSSISEDFFEGTLKVLGTIVGGILTVGLAALVKLIEEIVSIFNGDKTDSFEDLCDEISKDLMPDWRDKFSNLDKGKREKVYAKFKANKSFYKNSLKESIKKDLQSKSDIVSSINDGFTTEAKCYIKEQIQRFRLMLN